MQPHETSWGLISRAHHFCSLNELCPVWNLLSPILYSSLLSLGSQQLREDLTTHHDPIHPFQFSVRHLGDCVSVCLLSISAP